MTVGRAGMLFLVGLLLAGGVGGKRGVADQHGHNGGDEGFTHCDSLTGWVRRSAEAAGSPMGPNR
jgi:hypothetical protein